MQAQMLWRAALPNAPIDARPRPFAADDRPWPPRTICDVSGATPPAPLSVASRYREIPDAVVIPITADLSGGGL